MLKIKTTPNLYGVTLMGDYDDLDQLYDSLFRYLSFYSDNNIDIMPRAEYEFLLSLNYDIRHCYQGDRGFESVDNHPGRLQDLGSGDFGFPPKVRKHYNDLYRKHKGGNLYFSVEILYPLIFHYMASFAMVLDDSPESRWFDTKDELGRPWRDTYTWIDAMRDRAAVAHFQSLMWENVQDLFDKDLAGAIYSYTVSADELAAPLSMYCEAVVHSELVNFPSLTRQQKIAFHVASLFEILGTADIEAHPRKRRAERGLLEEVYRQVNGEDTHKLIGQREFFDLLRSAIDPDKPLYRDVFNKFLDDTFGVMPDEALDDRAFDW